MHGYYQPIREDCCKDIFTLCNSVAKRFGFEGGAIQFYIANKEEFNSFSIASDEASQPHFVVLNSGLIEREQKEELTFVIGHEIGHLIFNHTYVSKTIQFIYPDKGLWPPFLQKLYDAWSKISEISADRIGLIANNNIEAAVKWLYRLSSGLDEKYFSTNLDNLADEVNTTFEQMKKYPAYVFASHPANVVRIKALQSFYGSNLWRAVISGQTPAEDSAFQKSMDEILYIVKKSPLTEQETVEMSFTAAAGMLLMAVDKDIDEDEYSYLINILSQYTQWPPSYLDSIRKANIGSVMQQSAQKIIEDYPWRAKDLFKTLFPIVNRDNKICDSELSLLLDIGTKELGLHAHAVVDIILEGIRGSYKPLY